MDALLNALDLARGIALFLLVLTVIIAVHELGHFVSARLLGMRVLEFGLGMPPKVCSRLHAGIEYSLNALPLGGFVRLHGQDDFRAPTEAEMRDPDAFTSRPWWAQAVVLFSGVAMNFILAVLLLGVGTMVDGVIPTGETRVLEVMPGSPAADAGMLAGDIIMAVDGTPPDRLLRSSAGREVTLQLRRGDQTIETRVTGRSEPPAGEGPIGFRHERVFVPVGLAVHEAIGHGTKTALEGSVLILGALWGMVTGSVPADLSGPVGLASLTREAAAIGPGTVLLLAGALSLNIGLINLLPLPALDGGRLFLVLLRGIARVSLPARVEARIHLVGLVFFLGLLLAVTVADVVRLIAGR